MAKIFVIGVDKPLNLCYNTDTKKRKEMIKMLKSAKEMNNVAGDVRNARIKKAKAEAEAYVNDVVAKAIEKKANDGCYSVVICISKADVGAGYVTDLLREAGYEVKRGTEMLTINW